MTPIYCFPMWQIRIRISVIDNLFIFLIFFSKIQHSFNKSRVTKIIQKDGYPSDKNSDNTHNTSRKNGCTFYSKGNKNFSVLFTLDKSKKIVHNSDNFYRARIARSTCLE